MDKPIRSYKDLIVWQKGIDLVIEIYKLTDRFPRQELYGLCSQMNRSAVSIPCNISEGHRRGTRKDYRHFLLNSYGSGAELETQIVIVKKLPFGKSLDFTKVDPLLDEIMKMLNRMINVLDEKEKSTTYSLHPTP